MNKYKYILFDMDGTIANTDQMIIDTMHILYDKYRNGIYTPVKTLYYFSGPPIAGNLKKEFPDMDQDFILNEFKRISWDLYTTTVTEYSDCRNVLLELKKHGFKLGVVTNKSREASILCLKVIHLDDVMDTMICFDDVTKCKPDPEGIHKALQQLGAKDLQEALYIGDNAVDLESADNANVDCILVTWGPRVLSKELKPRYWAKDYLEIKRILLDE